MTVRLDFNLLPSVEATTILSRLDTDLQGQLEALGYLDEAIARANGALVQFHDASAKEPSWVNESRIRAGLADFRSIEECVDRERRTAGLPGNPAPMIQSRHPLIHLMVLLRNANIHATSCKTRTQETTVISHLGEPHEYTYEAVVIEAFNASALLFGKASRRYQRSDIETALSWLLEKQFVFGVAHIFHEGVEAYCREVLTRCGPNQRMHATRLEARAYARALDEIAGRDGTSSDTGEGSEGNIGARDQREGRRVPSHTPSEARPAHGQSHPPTTP